MSNVAQGMIVYPKMLEKHLREELPFMATENIMMAAVEAGGDRQQLHEKIRQYSQQAGAHVKLEGRPNDLLDMLKGDESFAGLDFDKLMDPEAFIGRSAAQVDEFVTSHVDPLRDAFSVQIEEEELRV